MKVRLERLVDGEWMPWGTYDLSFKSEVNAVIDATAFLSKQGYKVRVIEV